jgi:hypothetical protein
MANSHFQKREKVGKENTSEVTNLTSALKSLYRFMYALITLTKRIKKTTFGNLIVLGFFFGGTRV